MDFLQLIRQRRSVRKFRPQTIEQEKVDLLKEAALRSPSGRNLRPWHFAFVTNREQIDKLAVAKVHGSQLIKTSTLAVVVYCQLNRSDTWVEDCSIASIYLQLAVEELGLGSCWVQIRQRIHNDTVTANDYVKQVLELPNECNVESIIAIGYSDQEKVPVPFTDLNYDKITVYK
jgi:nitroreductase